LFLATTTSFSSPEVEIDMGGQALEKWPRLLFVDSGVPLRLSTSS